MIKKILPLLFVSSCGYISYGQLPELIGQAVRGAADIPVTENFLDQQQYSFAKFKMGKSVVAITVLAEINGDTYLWISQDREKIYTKYGKIVETVGLSHDIKVLDNNNVVPWQFRASRSLLVHVSNPSAVISQDIQIKSFIQGGANLAKSDSYIYQEHFSSGKLSWSGINSFEISENGLVIRSEQFIHPSLPKIEMDFFYK